MNNLYSAFERLDILDNPKSDRVKKVAGLSRRSVRKKYGSLLVEGVQSFKELVADSKNAAFVKDIYLSKSVLQKHPEFYEQALDLTMWVHVCTDDVVEAMSKDAQGIVVVLRSCLFSSSLSDLDFSVLRKIVVLPNIQDPGNMGTIIRSADAFNVDLVVVCKGSVDVSSPKVIRSCAGSVFHVPIVVDMDFSDVVSACKRADLNVLGASGDCDAFSLNFLLEDFFQRRLFERNSVVPIKLDRPTCWVFGNEARGLSVSEKNVCTGIVKIDMQGDAESLNVAASICLHASSVALDS